ncbi:MAG: MFS transporter [Anaerolineales bacterium]|nr:MFS transporter [Anaerolineales bacterium]
MAKQHTARASMGVRLIGSAIPLTLLFLLIEFFDELHYGIQGAVMPSLRDELSLTYGQIGILLGLPGILNTFIEPVLMLLGDTAWRKRLIVGGGIFIILAVLMIGSAQSFPAMLVAFIIAFPASGAFVSLSQATLVDLNPGRQSHMMARWAAAGSLANLIGPLLVAGGFALGFGWRWPYFGLALIALGLILIVISRPFPKIQAAPGETPDRGGLDFRSLLSNLWQGLRNVRVLRWLVLLELADLMLDVFTGYAALYFADVVGFTPAQVGLIVTVMMAASLAADLLLIPLLERVPGRRVVRTAAALSIPVYAAFLLAPWPVVKIILLVGVKFTVLGWYPVLDGELFASMPGRSGTAKAVSSLAGLLGGGLIWLIGWAAEQAGLPFAMWLLMLGPVSLLLWMPKAKSD